MKRAAKALAAAWLVIAPAFAAVTVYDFDDAEQETRYRALIGDFRCPTCQNQNLAGSDAPIAQDLKQKTYEMIKDGRSDGEIRQYMLDRYGDFISYKPPVRPSTWILWFFPPLALLAALFGWTLAQKRKQKRPRPVQAAAPLSAKEEEELNNLLSKYKKPNDVDKS